ncbi:hypothetical protein [Streptomyces sp. NPDC090022]|uniref:hypothetical protein n=1 Tax=Streptomyces sp. NPDC090022 TaxID=3365920 RepID=UPI0038282BDD
MIFQREDIDLPEDRGCLRWVLGVPLALVHAVAALFCYATLAMRPDGPEDHRTRLDIEASATAVLLVSLTALLITVLPPFRRTLGRWWYAVPLLLSLVAVVRAKTA